jgi:HSP20 family molecular chaperone IbpA
MLMNDMFDDFFGDSYKEPKTNAMLCDVREKDDGYEMNLAMPGYKKEDIKVDFTDGYLNINADSSKDVDEKKEGKLIRQERYHGHVSRRFYIGNVDESKITAAFENGELKISFPKEEKKAVESNIAIE